LKTFEIAVIEGDGIGPEVTRGAQAAAEAAVGLDDANLHWTNYPWGTDYYFQQGRMAPGRFSRSVGAARCHSAGGGRSSAGAGSQSR